MNLDTNIGVLLLINNNNNNPQTIIDTACVDAM